jgi:hypothetical protein
MLEYSATQDGKSGNWQPLPCKSEGIKETPPYK